MIDYKELFYKSQAEIAETLEKVREIEERLQYFMQVCEENVMCEEAEADKKEKP